MKPTESFVEQPVRSLQTMLRVLAEDDPQLPTVVPDGIYGPATMAAVAAFQRRQGIPVTGAADQFTWEQVVLHYEPAMIRVSKAEPIEIVLDPGQVFRNGDSSPYVYLLQSMLLQLSNDHPVIPLSNHNGVIDDSTAEALAGFQALAGLPVTGEFDKITWKHLVRHFTLNAHHNTSKHRSIDFEVLPY